MAVAVLYGWEGNRRSDVAPAGLNGPEKGGEPIRSNKEYGTFYLFLPLFSVWHEHEQYIGNY